MPVGTKMLVSTSISAGIALLVVSLVISIGSLYRLEKQTQQQLMSLADVTGQNSQAALMFGDTKSATDTLASLRSSNLLEAAAIYDAKGELFASLVLLPVNSDIRHPILGDHAGL